MESDVFFEKFLDEAFGHNPNSKYKCWVRRLYSLGLISKIPREWQGRVVSRQSDIE